MLAAVVVFVVGDSYFSRQPDLRTLGRLAYMPRPDCGLRLRHRNIGAQSGVSGEYAAGA